MKGQFFKKARGSTLIFLLATSAFMAMAFSGKTVKALDVPGSSPATVAGNPQKAPVLHEDPGWNVEIATNNIQILPAVVQIPVPGICGLLVHSVTNIYQLPASPGMHLEKSAKKIAIAINQPSGNTPYTRRSFG